MMQNLGLVASFDVGVELKILSLCGSIRSHSSNSLILKIARQEIKEHEWVEFDISQLPYFDPDKQFSEDIAQPILEIRALAANADHIFIFTPEYAHGIPGILKNAFEWIFHEGTQKKWVTAVIGSAEGESTKNQLIEILKTMDFQMTDEHVLILKGLRSMLHKDGTFKDEKQKNDFLNFCRTSLKCE